MSPELGLEAIIRPKEVYSFYKPTYDQVEYGWKLIQHYWHLIFIDPGLQRLELPSDFVSQWPLVSKDVLVKKLKGFKDLKVLDCWDGWHLRVEDFWNLEMFAPGVEEVMGLGTSSELCLDLRMAADEELPGPLMQLSRLKLIGHVAMSEFFTLMERLPNLSAK